MEIPKEAMDAISIAAQKKLPISDLEFLGAPPKALSLLDDAGIVSIDQLLAKNKKQLLEIPSLGMKSVKCIIKSLHIYHKLNEMRTEARKSLEIMYTVRGILPEVAANLSEDT